MITGDRAKIEKEIKDIAISSLEKVYMGNFNVDFDSPKYVQLREMIDYTGRNVSELISEFQVVSTDSPYVTGVLSKDIVKQAAKRYGIEFFREKLKYHESMAVSKTKDFVYDFTTKISQQSRRWKAAVPKKAPKARKSK
jgi:hypothetical protein